MAKDPVCGMEVKSPAENTIEHNGAKYEFCSPSCKATFEADPSKYISTAPQPGLATNHTDSKGVERVQIPIVIQI